MCFPYNTIFFSFCFFISYFNSSSLLRDSNFCRLDGMAAFSKSDLLTVLSIKSEANVMNPKVLRSTKLHKPNFFDDYGILFIFINKISKKYK